MLPFSGNWDEDPREFLNWFFQCMGTTSDNNKARSFRYYLQADSDADEWYEELPQQEKLDWALVEALFRKKWIKEEVMGITETATVENEPQPVPTTCQSIPPPSEPIATPRTTPDTSDASKGDNERNASHDVTAASPTTNFDPKPSLSIPPDSDAPQPPPNTSETQPPPSAHPTKPKTPIAARIFTQTVKIRNVGLPTPYTPSDEPISPEPPPSTSAQHSSIFSLNFSFVFDLVWHPFVFHIQIP